MGFVKKKILIITSTLSKGGMQTQLMAFLSSFNRNRLEVTLALFRNKIEYELPKDINVIQLNKKGKFDILFVLRLIKLISTKKWYKVNSKLSGVNEYLLFIYGFLRKRNLIIEIRSSGGNKNFLYKKISLISKVFRYNKFKVVCNSRKAKHELLEFRNMDTIVINNGIDTSRFKSLNTNSKTKIENLYIGFVGRIVKEKNLETLILALNHVIKEFTPHVILGLWGNSDDLQYFINLQELIDKNGLKNNISFHKAISNIEEIYNKIDLLVLPSHYEGTPNVLLEAMSCETICLISRGANSDNFLSEDYTFDTQNYILLAQKINWIYNQNTNFRLEVGNENRAYVMEKYSLNSMVQSYSELYSD